MQPSREPEVLISEVGPRDGLQSIRAIMPTADKKRWISALYDAGLREIEVCSFVPAAHLPQMADAAEVAAHALTLPGLTVMALVPNLHGAMAAHSLANVRKTREEMIEKLRLIAALRRNTAPDVLLEAGISTAFGCSLQGAVPEDDVIWLASQCIAAGADESDLSDTSGYANPAQIRRLFRRLHRDWRARRRCTCAQHPRFGACQLPCGI